MGYGDARYRGGQGMSAPTGCSLPLRGRNAGVVSAAVGDEGALRMRHTPCRCVPYGVSITGSRGKPCRGGLRRKQRGLTLLRYIGTVSTQYHPLCCPRGYVFGIVTYQKECYVPASKHRLWGRKGIFVGIVQSP